MRNLIDLLAGRRAAQSAPAPADGAPGPVRYRHMEVFLFETCTHKCAYCYFAESGRVLDNSQLRPFRDPAFIDQTLDFFAKRTTETDKWIVYVTGGEPLLMPNFDRFVQGLKAQGNKFAIYSALLVGENHPAFRFLIEEGAGTVDYIMCSFHPEAEPIEDAFFARMAKLKAAGHFPIFRFVGHPDRLDRLGELSARCREIDVAFHPTPLFSPEYPNAYTPRQRSQLEAHFSSLSQVIQMENGLDTRKTLCSTGSDIFFLDMRNGDITPCASLTSPAIGNLYEDRLEPYKGLVRCPQAGISSLCDTHFQLDIVKGAEDGETFGREKRGFVPPRPVQAMKDQMTSAGIVFSEATPGIGQTTTAGFLALETEVVKAAYQKDQVKIHDHAKATSHPVFLRRQFPEAQPVASAAPATEET